MQEHKKCTRSSEDSDTESEATDSEYTTYDTKMRSSVKWTQKELNDLIRELRLPKDDAKHPASAFKNRKVSKRKEVKCLSEHRTAFSKIL